MVYLIGTETNQREENMNTMTITLETGEGELAVFTIEFKNSDFMNVVDSIDDVTIDNVFNQDLFKVI